MKKIWKVINSSVLFSFGFSSCVVAADVIHAKDASPIYQKQFSQSKQIISAWEIPGVKGISAIAISPNNEQLLAAEYDGTIKLLNLKNAEILKDFYAHQTFADALAFSPDGKFALSGATYQRYDLRLWNLEKGKGVWPMLMKTGVNDIQFSSDGQHALVAGYQEFYLVDIEQADTVWRGTIEEKGFGYPFGIEAVAFSPDNSLAFAKWGARKILACDIKTGNRTASFQDKTQPVAAFALAPQESILASAGVGGSIIFWDYRTQQKNGFVKAHNHAIKSIKFTPDGKYLVTVCLEEGSVKIWDFNTLRMIKEIKFPIESQDVLGSYRNPTLSSDAQFLFLQKDERAVIRLHLFSSSVS